jgi:predicted SprT family Zn-dependent metalloprotease
MSRLIYFYTKQSLEKVSFNPDLFARELKKALKILLPYEIEHLKNWLLFYTNIKPELKTCLALVPIK